MADFDLYKAISRRRLFTRSAALGGALAIGSAIPGIIPDVSAQAGESGTYRRGTEPPPRPEAYVQTEVEAVPFSHDDMGLAPSRWTHNGVDIPENQWLFFYWGYITNIAGRRPILLIRSFSPDRDGGKTSLTLTENAPGMFGTPTPIAEGKTFSGIPAIPYQKIKGDPDLLGLPNEWVYEMSNPAGNDTPQFLYRAGTQGHRIVEGSILDFRADYMPLNAAINPPGAFAPYFSWAAEYHGKFMDENVWFMGGCDRFFDRRVFSEAWKKTFYSAFVFSGVHADGVREWGQVYLMGNKSFGVYCKDGEKPVVSNDVKLDARFVHAPGDPERILPQEGTWRFGGKELHWHAESTANHANHFGPWYERESSKNFVRSLGAVESNIPRGTVKGVTEYVP